MHTTHLAFLAARLVEEQAVQIAVTADSATSSGTTGYVGGDDLCGAQPALLLLQVLCVSQRDAQL